MAEKFNISFGNEKSSIELNEQRFGIDLGQDKSEMIFDNLEENLNLGGEKMYAHFDQVYRVKGGDGGSGTDDYRMLSNKPKIEGNTLVGDKTFLELGLGEITPQEIDEIMFGGD